jgi:hypothetical protein
MKLNPRSQRKYIFALMMLAMSGAAFAAEPNEHWRCGPYDIRIIPGDSYIPGEYIVLDDDTGFLVRKNGRDAGHGVIRARMHEIEKGGCQYHSCPNGARAASWSGTTRAGKYNGSGELLTIDGVTYYTENLMSGKDEGRLLRTEKHLCKRVN